jgi:acetamidase/formamidase
LTGEFCVTALETSLHGRFRLTVLKNKNGDASTHNTHTGSSNRKHGTGGSLVDSVERSLFASHLANPRAETETHYVSMAFHESLDVAEKEALLDMIRYVY